MCGIWFFIFHFAAACGCVLSPYCFHTLLQHLLHNFLGGFKNRSRLEAEKLQWRGLSQRWNGTEEENDVG